MVDYKSIEICIVYSVSAGGDIDLVSWCTLTGHNVCLTYDGTIQTTIL